VFFVLILTAPVSAAATNSVDEVRNTKAPSTGTGVSDVSVNGGQSSPDGDTFLHVNVTAGSNERVAVTIENVPEDWTIDQQSGSSPYLSTKSDESDGTTTHQLVYKTTGSDGKLDLGLSVDVPADASTGTSYVTVSVLGEAGKEVIKNGSITVFPALSSSFQSSAITTETPPPDPSPGGAPVKLYLYDTDYDAEVDTTGLNDAVQQWATGTLTTGQLQKVITAWATREGVIWPNSDGDSLTDREEHLFGTPIAYADIDNDGYEDPVDPRPRTEDIPPNVSLSSDDFREQVTIEATDNVKLVSARISEPGEDGFTKVPLSGGAVEATVPLDSMKKYWVNVSDSSGNEFNILIETTSSGGANVKKAGTLTAATVFNPFPGDEIAALAFFGGLIVLGALFGSGGSTQAEISLPSTSSGKKYENPAQSVTNNFQENSLPIRLPSGTVTSEYDPALEEDIYRGNGWKYIEKRLPGVTKSDIGQVLRAPSKVSKQGDDVLVIGDNPTGSGSLQIVLNEGGVVISAYNVLEELEFPDDYNGQYSDRDLKLLKENWEHNKGRDEHLSRQQIRKTVKNADEIWHDANKGLLVFTRFVNGEYHIVRMWDRSQYPTDGDFYHVGTTIETDRNGYESEIEGLTKEYP
jgi:hypothetical protein